MALEGGKAATFMSAAVGNNREIQLQPPQRLTVWANDVFIKI